MSASQVVRVDVVDQAPLFFRARCEACAYLVDVGTLDFIETVDGLQIDAVSDGLVDAIGQDAVQTLIAMAFTVSEFRDRDRDMEDAAEIPAADTAASAVQPYRIVARDGVASAAELQRDLERAAAKERIDHGLAPSTVAAFKHVLAQNDVERLRSWLARRAPEERAELKRAMVAK
jgi:hypothetical protein